MVEFEYDPIPNRFFGWELDNTTQQWRNFYVSPKLKDELTFNSSFIIQTLAAIAASAEENNVPLYRGDQINNSLRELLKIFSDGQDPFE